MKGINAESPAEELCFGGFRNKIRSVDQSSLST